MRNDHVFYGLIGGEHPTPEEIARHMARAHRMRSETVHEYARPRRGVDPRRPAARACPEGTRRAVLLRGAACRSSRYSSAARRTPGETRLLRRRWRSSRQTFCARTGAHFGRARPRSRHAVVRRRCAARGAAARELLRRRARDGRDEQPRREGALHPRGLRAHARSSRRPARSELRARARGARRLLGVRRRHPGSAPRRARRVRRVGLQRPSRNASAISSYDRRRLG